MNGTVKSFSKMVFNKQGQVDVTFQPVQTSRYYIHLQRWLRYFKLSQIHIVDSDDVAKNPLDTASDFEKFLGLRNEISERNFVYNETKVLFPIITRKNNKKI